jgi:hypothetical protein
MGLTSLLVLPGRIGLYVIGAAVAYAFPERPNEHDGASRNRKRRTAGITDLPPGAEESQQHSLPPRGKRKAGYHA